MELLAFNSIALRLENLLYGDRALSYLETLRIVAFLAKWRDRCSVIFSVVFVD
ncbi:hypothetical protein CKA32_001313 [Geitlerinema sp. FC II]|nr:hypothetical protein CKA32_001313 [Geitlerinema sp. FC II]